MTWVELQERRNQRSRTYRDTANPLKHGWAGTLATLHYEGIADSGVYDTEVDLTSTRARDGLGEAPGYDRNDLSQETGTLTIGPNVDSISWGLEVGLLKGEYNG